MEDRTKAIYALYCRVSTAGQNTDNQKIRLLKWATDNKFKFVLFDEIESTRKTRPIKQKLLQRLRQGEFTAVVVNKLCRWARSSTELILETKELIDKGVGFISLSDNLDFTTASGKLQFQILSAFAEFERALISERTKEGLHRVKQSGTILGRPKGAKDKKKRARSGYYVREMRLRGAL
jgi:putative DNA-invertase from lambdoid prophage Rac